MADAPKTGPLVAGVDYYTTEDGLLVFTAHFLTRRGYCCKNGCRHCPYGFTVEPSAAAPAATKRLPPLGTT